MSHLSCIDDLVLGVHSEEDGQDGEQDDVGEQDTCPRLSVHWRTKEQVLNII